MFEDRRVEGLAAVPALDVERTREWVSLLAALGGGRLSDSAAVDAIHELERLKSAAAAAQARITEAFDRSQRSQAPQLKAVDEVSRSIASQVALARQDSPARGQRHLGLARALVREMPFTHSALTDGRISEYRAMLVVQAAACLSREDRQKVEAELAGRLSGLGDRRVADLARSVADRVDPAAATRRNRRAESERRVSIRPAPDTMSYLTALLPVADGVAAFAALRKHAESLRGQGDPRTVSQIVADTFVARLTGREHASGREVEVQVVMNERTLLRGDDESARVTGFGSVPAALARRLVRSADKAWIRRLYTRPETGELVAMESNRRVFAGRLRALLISRDELCRTPWCDAPIRHRDNVRPWAEHGRTEAANGQGLCEACNYTKEARGWRTDVISLAGHVVEYTTPTGHRYRSQAPPQPGAGPPGSPEERLRRLSDDAA